MVRIEAKKLIEVMLPFITMALAWNIAGGQVSNFYI